MSQDMISFVLPAVLIGLIGLVIGALAGYLLAGTQEPGSKETPRPKNLVEAARFWREKRSGKWVIEIDKQLIQDPSNLTARQREALQKAQAELRRWVGGDDLAGQAASRPEAAIPPPVQAAPSTSSSAVPPVAAAAPLIGRLSPASRDTPRPVTMPPVVEPVSTDLTAIIAKPIFGEKNKDKEIVTKSIAGQVDDIVQEHLPTSPFRNRVIRVQDSPQMGIEVVVDGQVFEGVGEVPDAGVQQFLRECVAEWERRSAK